MAAHRYWRLTGFTVGGNGSLALTEAQLCAGGARVDGSATITCPFAPTTGALADLKDGLTAAAVQWPWAAHSSPGFSVVWDLTGAGASVDSIRLSGSGADTFPRDLTLQYSDDTLVWVTSLSFVGIDYVAGALVVVSVPALTLFSAGEKGAWYDPSDMSTLFQDAAGTVPVTAVGQPVGKVVDKSGNDNHATQTVAGSRPILREDGAGKRYLEFNGSSSTLVTASASFSGADKLGVFVAMTQNSTAISMVLELSPNINTNQGTFYITSSENLAGDLTFRNRGAGANQIGGLSGGSATPITRVVSLSLDIAGTSIAQELSARIDGAAVDLVNLTSVVDSGSGNYGVYPLYIGSRGGASLFFNGRIYGLAIRGAASSPGQIATAETWLSRKINGRLEMVYLSTQARLRNSPIWPERLFPATELPPTTAHGHLREFPFFDVFNGGLGLIIGTVKEKSLPSNVPLARKVWLINEASGMVVRETWSDATTGAYEFRGVKQGVKYTVLAYDYTHTYRAVVADNLETT